MGEEKLQHAHTARTGRGPAALPKAQMSAQCAQRMIRNATVSKIKRFDSADYFMHQHLSKRDQPSPPCSAPSTAPSSARSDICETATPSGYCPGEMDNQDIDMEPPQPDESIALPSSAEESLADKLR